MMIQVPTYVFSKRTMTMLPALQHHYYKNHCRLMSSSRHYCHDSQCHYYDRVRQEQEQKQKEQQRLSVLRSMTYKDVRHLQTMLSTSASTSSTSPTTTTVAAISYFLTSYNDTIPYCTDWTQQYTCSHPLSEQQQQQIDSSKQEPQRGQNSNDLENPEDTTIKSTTTTTTTKTNQEDDDTEILCVVQPRTVQQVALIVRYCSQHRIPIIPLGGRTGLVGGTIPCRRRSTNKNSRTCNTSSSNDSSTSKNDHHAMELFLDTKYLRHDWNRHRNHNSNSGQNDTHQNKSEDTTNRLDHPAAPYIQMSDTTGIVQCTVGYTLQELQDYCTNHHNYTLPIDIGSKGSCTIGGVVATNAGGQYYYRYQSLLSNIIGLQFVTGTGEIVQWNYNNNNNNCSFNNSDHNDGNSSKNSHNNPRLRVNMKANTGYKLYPLLIGSEGTLGIITGVTIKCTPYLPIRQTMIVTLRRSVTSGTRNVWPNNECVMEHILHIVQTAKQSFGEILAAVEWMDPTIMHVITQSKRDHNDNDTCTKLQTLLNVGTAGTTTTQKDENDINQYETTNDDLYPHCILIETHGTNQQHDEEKCDDFFNTLLTTFKCRNSDGFDTNEMSDQNDDDNNNNNVPSIVVDVKLAKNTTDAQYFWSIRESANPCIAKVGYTYKYDVSIPDSYFHLLMEPIYERIYRKYSRDRIVITNWGHILDGNLHLNITDIGNHVRDDELLSLIEPYIYDQVLSIGGSISAEHGIGQVKNQYMNRIHDDTSIHKMRSIKHIFDPAGIMNPGKVLPPCNPIVP
jgi:FAD/FMN-containing dehydrogenase